MGSQQIPEENHIQFVQALARHERSIRGFVRSIAPNQNSVDDLMQEILVVAWKKFDQLQDVADFPKWVCAIARYQVLNYRRRIARDRLVLGTEVVQLIAEEGETETHKRDHQLRALENCIDELPSESKQMVQHAYHQGKSIGILAKRQGKKENAIYQKLWRIRQSLSHCVEQKVAVQTEAN